MKRFKNLAAASITNLGRQPESRAVMSPPFAKGGLGGFSVLMRMVVVLMIGLATTPLAQAQTPAYELTWVYNDLDPAEDVTFKDINDAGVVVGGARVGSFPNRRAILYATGQMRDLNTLGADWIDLDLPINNQQTSEWIAWEAFGINEGINGIDGIQIVGIASHIAGLEPERVFVLHDPLGPNPEFTLLPRHGDDDNRGAAINDLGIVVGFTLGEIIVFDLSADPIIPVGIPGPVDLSGRADPQEINNNGVIVTRDEDGDNEIGCVISPFIENNGSHDYTRAFVDLFPGDPFYGINDSGTICGQRHGIVKGPPSQRQDGGPLRFQYPGVPSDDDLIVIDNSPEAFFCDVNRHGNVCFTEGGRGWVYLDGLGKFNLDDQIVFDSPQDEAEWLSKSVQARGINDNGQIIIRTRLGPNPGVLLTPIVPGPGISVSPTSGLVTDESGGQASFEVVLDTQPAADVTIGISSSDTTEGTVNAASLTFTSANWDDPQTVIVTGADDPEIDGDIVYTIITAAATSTDPDYNGLDADNVSVTNLDNEQAPSVTFASQSSQNNVGIPDQGMAISTIAVDPLDDYVIADLSVTLTIFHDRAQDLEVFLIGPDGTTVELFSDVGGNGQDFIGTTLDDSAATSITDAAAPFSGTFRPEGNLGAFILSTTPGMWTLQVFDDKRKQTGTIVNWSFTVEY